MNNNWQEFPIYKREDNSYVITYNNNPYHVPNMGEWVSLWEEITEWSKINPGKVKDEPASAPLSEEEIRNNRINEIRMLLIDIDASSSRSLRAILIGDATDADKEILKTLEDKAKTLREELNNLLLVK